jgi:hypothetical protein
MVGDFELRLRAGRDRQPMLKAGDGAPHLSPLANSLKAACPIGRGHLTRA